MGAAWGPWRSRGAVVEPRAGITKTMWDAQPAAVASDHDARIAPGYPPQSPAASLGAREAIGQGLRRLRRWGAAKGSSPAVSAAAAVGAEAAKDATH